MKTRVLLVSAGLLLAAPALADDGIIREGSGERRDQLKKMELSAFPGDFGKLQGWTNGDALTTASIEGKPVVIFTFAGWNPNSMKAIAIAQRMSEAYGKDGLIVLGVHHPERYDDGAKAAKDKGATFVIAHDTSGAFRSALKVDGDPDFYFIDRAGNLRFADVDNASAERAAQVLTAESREDAAALPAKLADSAAQDEAGKWRTGDVSPAYLAAMEAEVPFELPTPESYEKVTWPEKNSGGMSANDVQGQHPPQDIIPYLETIKHVSGKRNPIKGKVMVVDFWASWCGPCKAAMPGLNDMQKQYKDELQIIGINGFNDTEQNYKGYLNGHKSAYIHFWDSEEALLKALNVRGIPHVMIISSDGTVRWQGNPHDPNFKKMVAKIVSLDPGVKARVTAKKAYLEKVRAEDASKSKGG